MSKILTLGKQVIANNVIRYIFSRYFTYFIQFVNSLFIAVYLGPYYLGIWGFINLIIQYFNQINLGIPLSMNAIAAIEKKDKAYVEDVFNVSNSMLLILFGVIVLLFSANQLFHLNFGEKFMFGKYALIICIIAGLNNLLTNFFNIYRIYGKLFEIGFNQTAFPVLMLICTFFFRGEQLLWSLVWSNLIAFILILILYIWNSPVKLKLKFDWQLAKKIQTKAIFLFIYNICFYLILMSTRSLISSYYNVTDFGFFTFAFSLANIILLLFQSFSTLIFPKVLNKLSTSSNEEALVFINKLRNAYMGLSHMLVHFVILGFPLFLYFFPKYSGALSCFRLISLTLVLFTNAFGYQGLLVAKGKEKVLSFIAIIALTLNVLIALLLIQLKLPFQFIILSTLVSYIYYSVHIGIAGATLLGNKKHLLAMFNDLFPIGLLLPYLSSALLLSTSASNVLFVIPCMLYFVLNSKSFINALRSVKEIIKKPDIVNIK